MGGRLSLMRCGGCWAGCPSDGGGHLQRPLCGRNDGGSAWAGGVRAATRAAQGDPSQVWAMTARYGSWAMAGPLGAPVVLRQGGVIVQSTHPSTTRNVFERKLSTPSETRRGQRGLRASAPQSDLSADCLSLSEMQQLSEAHRGHRLPHRLFTCSATGPTGRCTTHTRP